MAWLKVSLPSISGATETLVACDLASLEAPRLAERAKAELSERVDYEHPLWRGGSAATGFSLSLATVLSGE